MITIENFLDAMNEGLGYTFLQEYGYEMNKDDLVTIASEILFGIEDANLIDIDRKEFFNIINENLG